MREMSDKCPSRTRNGALYEVSPLKVVSQYAVAHCGRQCEYTHDGEFVRINLPEASVDAVAFVS